MWMKDGPNERTRSFAGAACLPVSTARPGPDEKDRKEENLIPVSLLNICLTSGLTLFVLNHE